MSQIILLQRIPFLALPTSLHIAALHCTFPSHHITPCDHTIIVRSPSYILCSLSLLLESFVRPHIFPGAASPAPSCTCPAPNSWLLCVLFVVCCSVVLVGPIIMPRPHMKLGGYAPILVNKHLNVSRNLHEDVWVAHTPFLPRCRGVYSTATRRA